MIKTSKGIQLEDRNIIGYKELIAPSELKEQIPITEKAAETVVNARIGIEDILEGKDSRKLMLVGPCSIHSTEEAKEYASLLKPTIDRVSDRILVVMRTYFEKPRTNDGWQGLITDPHLNGTNGSYGYPLARELQVYLANLGIPSGTEFLDMETPQYIDDTTAWACIGARTIESQPHRKMSSGLSMPVGYKNSTDGNVKNAVNAMVVAFRSQTFPGFTREGKRSIVYTSGNINGHIILRGGDNDPNYDKESIADALSIIRKVSIEKCLKLPDKIVVDASHGNSGKDYRKQPDVFLNVLKQIIDGNNNIMGMMLESYIIEGSQVLKDHGSLKKGISITDSCIGIETTRELLLEAHQYL